MKLVVNCPISEPELESTKIGTNDLITGTNEVQTSLIQANLVKIENGIRQGSAASDQIEALELEIQKNGCRRITKWLSGTSKWLYVYAVSITKVDDGLSAGGGSVSGTDRWDLLSEQGNVWVC